MKIVRASHTWSWSFAQFREQIWFGSAKVVRGGSRGGSAEAARGGASGWPGSSAQRLLATQAQHGVRRRHRGQLCCQHIALKLLQRDEVEVSWSSKVQVTWKAQLAAWRRKASIRRVAVCSSECHTLFAAHRIVFSISPSCDSTNHLIPASYQPASHPELTSTRIQCMENKCMLSLVVKESKALQTSFPLPSNHESVTRHSHRR